MRKVVSARDNQDMLSLRSLLAPARGPLILIAIAAAIHGCSSSARPKGGGDETGGEAGDTGGSGGKATGGSSGKATGGNSGSGGTAGASGGSGGASETGGAGGSSGAGGSVATGGAGGKELPDSSVADSSPPAADGGYKLDPKSPIVACNGGYNLQGVTADDFCSFYEMYCMYDPTGMAKNPSGTALPPGTGSWFYKDRADCITRYDMASMPAKGCRAGQLCRNKAGGCTHATGHFSNCP